MKKHLIYLFGLLVISVLSLLYLNFRTYEASEDVKLGCTHKLSSLGRRGLFELIMDQYKCDYPFSDITDEQLLSTIINSKVELKRRSRWVTITVKSHDKNLANKLADIYAKIIEDHYCNESNSIRHSQCYIQSAKLENKCTDDAMRDYIKSVTPTLCDGPLRIPPVQP